MSEREYRSELQSVVGILQPFSDHIDIKGDGRGQFIFAEKGSRSVEISRSQDGVWVEYFQEDDVSHDMTFTDYEEAVDSSVLWLSNP